MKKKLCLDTNWWISDTLLNTTSYNARGVLSVLMCHACHEDNYGVISSDNQQAMTLLEVNMVLTGDQQEKSKSLAELFHKGLIKEVDDRIVIPRMIEEAQKSEIYRRNGKQGGNPALGGYTDEGFRTKKGKILTGVQLKAFENFWNIFDYKKGKAAAADAWLNLKVDKKMYEGIIKGAMKESSQRKIMIDQGRTPKYPEGWLSARRWEDE